VIDGSTAAMRIYVTGRLAVESDGRAIRESDLPSRQARRLLACLVCERSRPLSREELATMLWEDAPPNAWESSLHALTSKLRKLSSSWYITSDYGAYQLRLPSNAWVDWEEAARALDEAEGAVRSGRFRDGWGAANVAAAIAKRGFLAGDHGLWVETKRRRLECLMRAHAASGNRAEAIRAYHHCRTLLAEELGVSPSPETERAYLGILRA